MASLLRHHRYAARASRQLIEVVSPSQVAARRSVAFPRPLYAAPKCRSYATPSDKKKPRKEDEKSGSPPGSEHLYDSTSPMSSGSKPPKGEEPQPGREQFTELEKQELRKTFQMVKKGMPASLAADMEKTWEKMLNDGMQPELRETVKDVQANGLSPARVAKLVRLTLSLVKKASDDLDASTPPTEERAVNARPKNSPQKEQTSNGKDGSKNGSKKGKKADQIFPTEIKFDLSNALISAFLAYMLYRLVVPIENSREITWQEFRNTFLDKGLVEKLVVVNGSRVRVHLHRESVASLYPESPAAQPMFFYFFSIGSVEAFERRVDEAQSELSIPSSQRIPISYHEEGSWFNTFLAFAPTLLFIGAIMWVSRRATGGGGGGQGGIFGMGRSRAKKFNHETDVKVKFADVAGMDEAKTEIMEFVKFLKEPGVYQKLGAKIPRGAILSGPPGTGKTLLAKATAGESGVPFFSVSGSEFVEMFVGVGASRVRDLFQNARKSTPCIIFIDEIDAIGKSRSKGGFGGGNDEREATLNQILTEMDGFNTQEQVVVLAGTNRADILDRALMRPGRFDRHIAIDRPTMEGRKQIFGVHLKNIVTNEDLEHIKGRLAALTPGFSGADIANAVNEAALIAARGANDSVTMSHFEQAIERVVGGLEKKTLVMSPEEKKTVAYHEAGHAICGWYFEWCDSLLKVSIIPRGQGLGYAQYLPGGGADAALLSQRQMMDRMAMTLGGRVSEELNFDTVTSGASDDFNKVTRMATAMVTKWGMSDKIGYIYYPDSSESQEAQLQKPFSEETARMIDSEVKRIVTDAYNQCKQLLTDRKREVTLVAEELLVKEALTRDDLVRLLGPRPFPDQGEFGKYFGGGSPPNVEGKGKNPGGIGDSGPSSGPGGSADLPPGLGRGPEDAAPSLYKTFDETRP